MKKFLIYIALLLNLLFAVSGWLALQRLGGWRYTYFRLKHGEDALYQHRKQLFERMQPKPGAIVFLGDSQTEQCEWAEFLRDTLPILNRGICADHTGGVYDRLDEVLRHKPLKIYLLVGVNDLLFGTPPEQVEVGYRKIVEKIRRESKETALILESVLPVNNAVKHVGIKNETIQAMNTRIAQIAKDYALPYLDIYSHLTNASGELSEQFTADGIHLNAAGYAVWAKTIRSNHTNTDGF